MITTRDVMGPFFADVQASPFRIAPERAVHLREAIMKGEIYNFQLAGGNGQMEAFPTEKRIDIAPSALASLWAMSFAAFHTMDVASRIAATPEGQAAGVFDLAPVWDAYQLSEMTEYARQLLLGDQPWPTDLPQPIFGAAFESEDGRINNLFLAAVSIIILHEIAHIYLDHSHLVDPPQSLRQEHAADKFAVEWPLKFATRPTREFRALAISVALSWLLMFERAKWGGGDHPTAIIRFREAVALFNLPPDSPALENAFYALKAIFDAGTDLMPEGMAAQGAFDWVEMRLVELFPRP